MNNSWDLFIRPFSLMSDIWANLAKPRTMAVSVLLAVLMLFTYIIFTMVPDDRNSFFDRQDVRGRGSQSSLWFSRFYNL